MSGPMYAIGGLDPQGACGLVETQVQHTGINIEILHHIVNRFCDVKQNNM